MSWIIYHQKFKLINDFLHCSSLIENVVNSVNTYMVLSHIVLWSDKVDKGDIVVHFIILAWIFGEPKIL